MMAAAFRCHPPPCCPVVLLIVILVGIIPVIGGISINVGIVVSLPLLSLLLVALRHPFVLLFMPAGCCVSPQSPYHLASPSCSLVAPDGCCVLHCISCHIILCCPRILLLRQLVVACRTPLSPSLVELHHPLVLSLCRLVVDINKLLNKLSQFLLCTKWLDEGLFDCCGLHHSKVATGRREHLPGGSVSPFGNNPARQMPS